MPKLYSTGNDPFPLKIVHAHIFFSSSDWFIFETDGEDLLFCFVVLAGDYMNSELGYVNLSDLKAINIDGMEVDFDLYWTPCPANQVRTICRAKNWELQQPNKQMANLTA